MCMCVCIVMIPLDLTEKGIFASNFGMLGLGDIVIPGAVMLFCYLQAITYTVCSFYRFICSSSLSF